MFSPADCRHCNSRTSTSPSLSHWRGGATPTGNVHELWRAPGHIDDGAFSEAVSMERKIERELEARKRLAGDFVVSSSPTQSIGPPSPLSRRGMYCKASAHSPYLDAWKPVTPPSGRWVLEHGRPRCVPESPVTTLSEASVEAWFHRCRPVLDKLENDSEFQPQVEHCVTPERHQECLSPRKYKDADTMHSKTLSPGSFSSEDDEDDDIDIAIANRILVDETSRTKRIAKKTTFDCEEIEDLSDILKALDNPRTPTEESKEELRRFSWMGTKAASMNMKPLLNAPKSRRVSLIGRGLPLSGMQPRAKALRAINPRKASIRSGSSRDRFQPRIIASCSMNSARSGSVAELQTGRRKQNDQRSELKRLQQMLLTSAQQAFDTEIWESCGIEAEHLKRQQLATLLSTGLAKPIPKTTDEDDADTSMQPSLVRSSSSLKRSGSQGRVMLALGVHFKDTEDVIEDQQLAMSAKITHRRKSGVMG